MIRMELLRTEDIEAVLELEKLCFPMDPWGRIAFEDEVDNPISVFLTAVDENSGELVGYGGLWLVYDVGNVTNIAVHPDYRRTGIGREILGVLIRICREKGMAAITLAVRHGNLPAIRMYENAGFQACGLRKRYYQDNEDALIMTKELG